MATQSEANNGPGIERRLLLTGGMVGEWNNCNQVFDAVPMDGWMNGCWKCTIYRSNDTGEWSARNG